MAAIIDKERYAKALSQLDEDARSWVENAIPDAIAEHFVAATQVALCTDFHRPVRPEDAKLYNRNTDASVWLTFVTPPDIDNGWTCLGNPISVCCLRTEFQWQYGELRRVPGSTIEERCRYYFSGEHPEGGFVMLLSFDGIQKELVEAVKNAGGMTIVVEDQQPKAKELIDPDNYDMRCPANILQDILKSLEALRQAYQTRPHC